MHRGRRWRITLSAGIIAGLLTLYIYQLPVAPQSDWEKLYRAAWALRTGQNPYVLQAHDQFPLYYPLPAALLALPLTLMSVVLAQAVWMGLSTAAFAAMLQQRGGWALCTLASAPFLHALILGQWSPLLSASSAFPWLGLAWVAKPSIGLAYFLAWPSRRALCWALGLTVVSLLIMPRWPLDWLAAVTQGPHLRPPVTRPGGFLLLLAWVRWRDPRARLLGTLALVPQTTMLYELVHLLLIPRTLPQMALLLATSYLGFVVVYRWLPINLHDFTGFLDLQWPVWLVTVYLPALALLLAERGRSGGSCCGR